MRLLCATSGAIPACHPASQGREVGAPVVPAIIIFELQNLSESVPVDIMVRELTVTRWTDSWWRWVPSLWMTTPQAASDSICSLVLHVPVALAQDGCSLVWAAQVCKRFMTNPKLVVAGAPTEVQSDSNPNAFEQQQQLAFDAVPLGP